MYVRLTSLSLSLFLSAQPDFCLSAGRFFVQGTLALKSVNQNFRRSAFVALFVALPLATFFLRDIKMYAETRFNGYILPVNLELQMRCRALLGKDILVAFYFPLVFKQKVNN